MYMRRKFILHFYWSRAVRRNTHVHMTSRGSAIQFGKIFTLKFIQTSLLYKTINSQRNGLKSVGLRVNVADSASLIRPDTLFFITL